MYLFICTCTMYILWI